MDATIGCCYWLRINYERNLVSERVTLTLGGCNPLSIGGFLLLISTPYVKSHADGDMVVPRNRWRVKHTTHPLHAEVHLRCPEVKGLNVKCKNVWFICTFEPRRGKTNNVASA